MVIIIELTVLHNQFHSQIKAKDKDKDDTSPSHQQDSSKEEKDNEE